MEEITFIPTEDLIEFDIFSVLDEDAVNTLLPIKQLEASENILLFLLKFQPWKAWEEDGLIGYGTKAPLNCPGYSEAEAYSAWISAIKNTERKLKSLLPITQITQTQYDALLTLFYFNKTFTEIGEYKVYKLSEYIKTGQWDYICAALLLASGTYRTVQISLPNIIMLADYGSLRDREWVRTNGLQEIRKLYPDRLPSDIARKQAELVYFKETSRFLPGLTQTRKRQIVNDAK